MPDYNSNVKKNLSAQLQDLNSEAVKQAVKTAGASREQLKEQYNAMIASLGLLNRLMEEQYEVNRETGGMYRLLDDESYSELTRRYEAAALCCDAILQTAAKDPKLEPLTRIVSKVSADLANDSHALMQYPKMKKPVSFQSLIDQARTKTLDLEGQEIHTVGAAISKRFIFSYTMPDGEKIEGVFTPKKYLQAVDLYQKEYANITGRYPAMKKVLDMIYDHQKNQEGRNADAELNLKELENMVLYLAYTEQKPLADYAARFRIMVKSIMGTEEGIPELNELCRNKANFKGIAFTMQRMDHLRQVISAHRSDAKISDGSRIDSRNSAMSVVADLLGRPDLLAKAIPMKIRYQGQEIEGTFMEMAKGLDCNNPDKNFLKYTDDNVLGTDGIRDICDLPVLDFICGNTDRHMGNMMYQFDQTDKDPKKHRFLGVQGIDNDLSFGTHVPGSGNADRNRMAALNDLNVISQSMANAIMSLKPEVLRYELRNLELTEEQLDAACKRLKMVQKKINEDRSYYRTSEAKGKIRENSCYFSPGRTRILPDKEFRNLDYRKLAVNNHSNVFSFFSHFTRIPVRTQKERVVQASPTEVHSVAGFVLENEEAWRAENMKQRADLIAEAIKIEEEMQAGKEPKKTQPKSDSAPKRTQPDPDLNRASQMLQRVDSLTINNKTSVEFEDFRAAVARYSAFCQQNNGTMLSEDLYQIRRSLLRDIVGKSKAYLDHKKKELLHSRYAKSRIAAVKAMAAEAEKMYKAADPNFYDKINTGRTDPERAAIRDQIHDYADRELDAFNRRMRAEALKLKAQADKEQPTIIRTNDDIEGPLA